MTDSPSRRSVPQVVDVVATVVLAVVGLTAGIVLGGLFLIFTPTGDDVEAAWVSTCLGMFALPLLAAIVGVVRIVVRRTGFWVPLVGIALVAGLVVVLQALSGQVEVLTNG